MSNESNSLYLDKDTYSEVDLISLSYEKLPKYRLKADCNIQFSGYQHSDFIRAEQIKEEVTELSNEQIEKTLEYFLLCGLRVCKMTNTFEDIAALRLLVEEQKAHMDEAANIGLNLLHRNIQLEQRITTIEDQLISSKDTVNQLKHQLQLKDDLLRLLHNEIEEAEDSNSTVTDNASTDSSFALEKVNIKKLESKLSKLEDENAMLRNQQVSLNSHTDFMENKEQQLIDDCVFQLLSSTKTVEKLSADLNKKTNDYLNQHEEISRLLTTNIDLDNKVHQLLTDNDNLVTQLRDQQTKQFTLTKELSELRDRYDECINLLNEHQDHIRQLKKKYKREMMKNIPGYRSGSPDINFTPSLAMEFEESSRKDTIISEQSRAIRVMEQARTINSNWMDVDETSSGFTDDLSSSIINTEMDASVYGSFSGNYLLRKSIQEDCEKRRLLKNNQAEHNNSLAEFSYDANSNNTVSSFCTLEAYRHHQNRFQAVQSLNTNILNSELHPLQPHTGYRVPEKLKLVKPIEGSQTLRTWQNLATPSITKALFEEQSHSVCFRGQQPLILSPSPSSPGSEHSHSSDIRRHSSVISSDFEDIDCDEMIPVNSSKSSANSAYNNSKLLHSPNNYLNSTNMPPTSHFDTNNVFNQHRDRPPFSLNLETNNFSMNKNSYSSSGDLQDATPVNELKYGINNNYSTYCFSPDGTEKSFGKQRTMPSWLDGLTVKSIMNNILGNPFPHLPHSVAISHDVRTSISTPFVSSTLSSTPNSSSIIGRLTSLPPLAQRRLPQPGLNLVMSMSSSENRIVHRLGNVNDDIEVNEFPEDLLSPGLNGSQID